MRQPNRTSAAMFLSRLTVALLVLASAIPLIAADQRKAQVRYPPRYPELARRMGVSGVVQVDATVAPDGKVVKAVAQSGHNLLVPAAEEAVLRWKFVPASTESHETIDIDFEPSR